MARLYPTLMVVPLLLAACAGSGSSPMTEDAAYLHALSSDYSIRADQFDNEGIEKLAKELPESLVAGNGELTVAAAMFQKDDYLAVDLVIYNHSGDPVEISRADMYVLDYMGTRLRPVEGWKGAENYGLRGRIKKETEYVYLEGKDVSPGRFSSTPSSSGGGKASGSSSGAAPVYSGGSELDMLTEPVEIHSIEIKAPQIMTVDTGESRPYWAYFESKDLVFPLSAVVRMDGKRLIFRFEGPTGEESAAE